MARLPWIFLAAALATAARAADAPKPSVNCRGCHTTSTPTKEKPALVKCPRAKVMGFHSVDEAVKTIAFPGKDEYGPVKFSHRAHAEMAEMGESCGACHHYNQARSIQECRECHSPERLRDGEALGKPDLHGARHRLCISCHRAWDGEAKCASCHALKGKAPAATAPAKAPASVLFPLPDGKKVLMPHTDHAGMYGAKCADCHQKASCGQCHGRVRAAGGARVAVGTCAKCHADGVPGKRR
ncbi:MAG: hypothetical protein HYX59_00550 [Elusimicrobia bacterium]|nr:hypothetical protein [Elusimicrobiota bacterium]